MSQSLFEDVGKQPGLLCWRVEKLQLVSNGDVNGKLYAGDSYLFLHSSQTTSGLSHTIHIWLGEGSSTDEAAAAAMYATQLDQALGGVPTVCRHKQGAETPEFVRLFPQGLQYLAGGVASGLKAPSAEDSTPVLYQVSGSRAGVRTTQVPCDTARLNSGDCFVLDSKDDAITLWIGAASSLATKSAALSFATQVRDDLHAGVGKLQTIAEGDKKSPEALSFFKALGAAKASSVRIARPAVARPPPPAKLYALTYTCEDGLETGWPQQHDEERVKKTYTTARAQQAVKSHKLVEVTDSLTAEFLKADAAYVLLAGGSAWVWLGRFVPLALREVAMTEAETAVTQNELPTSSPVQMMRQGLETPLFKQYFPDWDQLEAAALGARKARAAQSEDAPAEGDAAVDAAALIPAALPEEPEIDDGSGAKKVWRVVKFELVEVPESEHGSFSAGDCYVVLYTTVGDSPSQLLYMWQGRDASTDERGACALQAIKLDETECKGAAVHVRVTQGKEPRHFIDLWQGKMAVHLGGVASGYRTVAGGDEAGDEASGVIRLYHVRSSSSNTPSALEVSAEASNLNSGDVFVIVTPTTAYTWTGKYSSAEEQAAAAAMAKRLLEGAKERESVDVKEGDEPDAFWEALGGKAEYSSTPSVGVQRPPRLFQVNDAKTGGKGVAAEEVPNFCQDDLAQEDVYVLDTVSSVAVWVGSGCTENEQKGALAFVDAYLDKNNRAKDIPVTVVKAGSEPVSFTGYFHGWDSAKKPASAADFEARIAELRKQSQSAGESKPEAPSKAEKSTPANKAPAEKAPTEKAPAETAPAEEAPAETAPAEEAPAETAPADKAPAETAPADKAPAEEAAAETAPADKAPAEMVSSAPKPPTESPAAAPSTPEPTNGVSVKDGVAAMNAKNEAAPPVISAPASPQPKSSTHLITPHTQRGKYEPQGVDPSGTKGTEVKFQAGKDLFPLDQLKGMVGADGIDPSAKEQYLSEEEFKQVFGVEREAFMKLPVWRRQLEKKKHGLF